MDSAHMLETRLGGNVFGSALMGWGNWPRYSVIGLSGSFLIKLAAHPLVSARDNLRHNSFLYFPNLACSCFIANL